MNKSNLTPVKKVTIMREESHSQSLVISNTSSEALGGVNSRGSLAKTLVNAGVLMLNEGCSGGLSKIDDEMRRFFPSRFDGE